MNTSLIPHYAERKMREVVCRSIPLLALVLMLLWTGAAAAPGLLIVAHGAPSPRWNQPVLDLKKQTIEGLGKESPFGAVEVAFLEMARPTIPEGVKVLEKAGCDHIIVVPLFIAPSSHSLYDLPTVLGLYSEPEALKTLREEGGAVVSTKAKITITQTLSGGDILLKSALKRTKELSKDPANEALVIFSHGDENFKEHWESLCRRAAIYVCGKTGITFADWAFVGVGQEYGPGAFAILNAAKKRKRVLIIGIYVGINVKMMHNRTIAMSKHLSGMLKGIDVVFAERSLLPDPEVAKWITDTATQALASRAHPAPIEGDLP